MSRIRWTTTAALLVSASMAAAQTPPEPLPTQPALGPNPASQVQAPERPAVAPVTAPEAGQGFTLNGIRLEGNTAIPTAELAPIWQDLIGKRVSVATLTGVAAQISAAYRERGYILSQAVLPEQTVSGGIVRLVLVEGFIDEVSLTGGKANQQRFAARVFAPVPADRPLRQGTLERSVLLSRDTFGSVYGGSVETVLEPSPGTFGAADLGVLITPDPISGYFTADNRGSRLYGNGVTVGAGLRSYNLLGLNERLDAIVAYTPEDSALSFGSFTFDVPIEPLLGTFLDGARFELNYNASRGDPDLAKSGSPAGLTALVNQRELTARLVVPFIRTRSQNLFGRLGLTFLESDTDTEFDGTTFPQSDKLSVLEARGTWDFADRAGGVNLVDVSLRQGLDLGDVYVSGDGPAAGSPNFTLAQATLSRLQSLGASSWSLYGEAIGQYAANVVPNSERFYLGNSTIGRGFAPGNTSGDSGWGARLELRRDIGDDVFPSAIEAAEFYAFGDYGRAFDKAVERDGEQWEPLGSVGVGARIDIRDWFSITPEIARQTDGIPTDTTDPDLETRFFIGAVARY